MNGNQEAIFPFHYGQEAESYTFYRVPKILFTAEVFDHLSTDAKLLYGILMDRMQLSAKNGWIDEDGKVFIYYQRQKIMDALTCGNKKAGQLLAELDDQHGIGLITRIHQGLGKPDKIYVHKCIVPDMQVRGSPQTIHDSRTAEAQYEAKNKEKRKKQRDERQELIRQEDSAAGIFLLIAETKSSGPRVAEEG